MPYETDLIRSLALSAIDRPARRLAVSALQPQPARRRRPVGGAGARRELRDGAALGGEVRTGLRPSASIKAAEAL